MARPMSSVVPNNALVAMNGVNGVPLLNPPAPTLDDIDLNALKVGWMAQERIYLK
jgi:hypothetical protein